MKRTRLVMLVLSLVIGTAETMPAQSLAQFRSDAELSRYLELFKRRMERRAMMSQFLSKALGGQALSANAAPGITNTQHAGVDEGGIVKLHVDWYGNARPIFIGQRVFALLGYELVEGAIRGEGIQEVGRVDFTPQPARTARH